jgi:hypothetical protein
MTTLRVLLSAPPSATRADPWALFDGDGRCVRRGRNVPAEWPSADVREAVLAAELVRIVALTLPPLPAQRVAAAATFALEDQLATTGETPAIGVSAQQKNGSVLANVTSRAMLVAVAAFRPPFARVLAEPALAPAGAGWTWYASGATGGFVRRADGSAFAIGAPGATAALPGELASSLTQAAHANTAPTTVAVALPSDDASLARWTRDAGRPFVRATAWQWDTAPPEAFATAPDLLAGEFARVPAAPAGGTLRLFRPALVLCALALGVNVAATIAQWAWLKVDLWRTARAQIAIAQEAQLADATSPESAVRAIVKRHADLRHRAGLAAPADALPLLARAAPALSAVPSGALKSATYADGAWTIEFASLDPATQASIDRALRNAGANALQAKTAGGYRMRISLSP